MLYLETLLITFAKPSESTICSSITQCWSSKSPCFCSFLSLCVFHIRLVSYATSWLHFILRVYFSLLMEHNLPHLPVLIFFFHQLPFILLHRFTNHIPPSKHFRLTIFSALNNHFQVCVCACPAIPYTFWRKVHLFITQ